ncbi:cobalamin B12-binding domain-containing protein [Namhaeicola litoreus]|uniref:B12-binding domain-containing protein n=1 Tax=Namhaeicola litoreus TaxID=1052145 RepID=A0ABW3Y2S7_9FLAO
MEDLFQKISDCVEFGKINKAAPYPPNMKDQDGADELTIQALEQGASAKDVLSKGLIIGMEKVGIKFRENKVFVPQVLMSAKAMNTAMEHLKPLFAKGNKDKKGVFIIGTVAGDLHDIGKNLVSMIVEGNGYEVIDLGTDVPAKKFLDTINEFPDAIIGLSSLLTTTMVSMENIVQEIKSAYPNQKVTIGGAPITQDFCDKIGADNYSPDPQGVVEFMNKLKKSA